MRQSPENAIDTDISRVTRSKRQTKRSYDRLSKWYTIFGLFERKQRINGLQRLDVREGENVLEIGFGPGECIIPMAGAVGNSGRVYGIDISEGMCRTARFRIERSSVSARVGIICGDAASLPFKDDSFDAIFMSFVLELFDTPEIPVVLEECRRVLKTKGRICVVALSRKKEEGVMTKLYGWLHGQFQEIFDCRPIPVRELLESAGFGITDVEQDSIWGIPVEIVVAELS